LAVLSVGWPSGPRR